MIRSEGVRRPFNLNSSRRNILFGTWLKETTRGPSGFNSPPHQLVQETHLSLVSHPHPVWPTRTHPGTVTKTDECFLSLPVINIPRQSPGLLQPWKPA